MYQRLTNSGRYLLLYHPAWDLYIQESPFCFTYVTSRYFNPCEGETEISKQTHTHSHTHTDTHMHMQAYSTYPYSNAIHVFLFQQNSYHSFYICKWDIVFDYYLIHELNYIPAQEERIILSLKSQKLEIFIRIWLLYNIITLIFK